jgi:hypothetical protein
VLVLGKWTLGDSPAAFSALLAATSFAAVFSYFFIEKPLRHGDWSRSQVRTLAMGAAVIGPLFLVVHKKLPQYTQSYNDNLPALLGVAPPAPWTVSLCPGEEALTKLADPFSYCLGAARTSDKPNVLYLLGDSHAAQLFPMIKLATESLPISPRFINLADVHEFVVPFTGPVQESRVLNYVLANAQRDDVVTIAFHRGRLNASADKHTPLDTAVLPNQRSKSFIAAMGPYIDKMAQRGIKVILVGDTPLMGAVATSSACALQIKLFGSSICRVSKEQDLHTRSRQDQVFAELARRSNAVHIWDTIDEIFGNAAYIDVLDESGGYIMSDWNHLTEQAAVKLTPSFRQFLRRSVLGLDPKAVSSAATTIR